MSETTTLLKTISAWPLAYRVAWAGVALVVGGFLFAAGLFWADLDVPALWAMLKSGDVLGLISKPFASDTWDRVIVLVGCLWCWTQLRPKLHALPSKPQPLLGLPLLLVGFALVPGVWFCYGQIGARPVLIWLFYVTAFCTLVGMTLTQFGFKHVRGIAFILAFAIIALPIPGRFNVPIQQTLQNITTTFAHGGMKGVGLEVVRQGFVLRLPHGDLGVVEACSGIRSLTSLLAIAAFVGFLRGFSPLRGITLLALSIPVIIIVNSIRVFLTGVLQEYVSRDWALGWRHEAVGYAMVFLGLGLILLLAKVISPPAIESPEIEERPNEPSRSPAMWAGALSALIAVLGVAGGIIGASWPSVARSAVPDGNPPLDSIPMEFGQWKGETLEIDKDITAMLHYNTAIHRRYRDKLGHEVDIWVIYWSTAKSVKGYHHPDICMTNRGSKIDFGEQRTISTPAGTRVPITYREFTGEKMPKQYIGYWTQEGRTFWTPEDETAAFAMAFPFEWIRKRMGPRPADASDDRIVVLIGSISKDKMWDLSGQLTDALYDACPWAKPN